MTKAAVAISGGIDSLYTAHLLIEAGYDVEGIHFITGYEPGGDTALLPSGQQSEKLISHCPCSSTVIHEMNHVADQLGIRIHIIDCSDVFQNKVVDYFVTSYQAGKTPSPCLACNPTVKFGALLNFSRELGAGFLATGHYAKIDRDETNTCHLHKGEDPRKDQSYFLAFLSQEQLKQAKFPLGDKRKSEIIQRAKQAGLSPVTKKESQDICFITGNDYKKFLLNCPDFSTSPGPIKTLEGVEIGRHQGLHSFTIGQRKGINCPGPAPYYVLKLEGKTNSLIVGFKEDLLASSCNVSGISWINKPPGSTIQLTTYIRYRHSGAASALTLTENNTGIITFDTPVSAITPGQGAVFYSGSEVLGGGWID